MGLFLTLLHSERPKLYTILAFPSAIELGERISPRGENVSLENLLTLRRENKKKVAELLPLKLITFLITSVGCVVLYMVFVDITYHVLFFNYLDSVTVYMFLRVYLYSQCKSIGLWCLDTPHCYPLYIQKVIIVVISFLLAWTT